MIYTHILEIKNIIVKSFIRLHFFTEMFYRDHNRMMIMLKVDEKSVQFFPPYNFITVYYRETKQPLYYPKCAGTRAHTHTYTHSTSRYPFLLLFIPKSVEKKLIILRC